MKESYKTSPVRLETELSTLSSVTIFESSSVTIFESNENQNKAIYNHDSLNSLKWLCQTLWKYKWLSNKCSSTLQN